MLYDYSEKRYLVENGETILATLLDALSPKPGGTAEVKLTCDAALTRRDDRDWDGVRQVIHLLVQSAR